MNKKRLTIYTFLATSLFCQAAFAETKDENTTPKVTKEKVEAASADYQTEDFERSQPRRSALFLHILDNLVKASTLAKLDTPEQTGLNSKAPKQFGSSDTIL